MVAALGRPHFDVATRLRGVDQGDRGTNEVEPFPGSELDSHLNRHSLVPVGQTGQDELPGVLREDHAGNLVAQSQHRVPDAGTDSVNCGQLELPEPRPF